jgi:hypothetical protein
MGLATHAFADVYGRLPNPAESINPAFSATGFNPWNQATGPLFQLLPYLEQAPLYNSIRSINSQAAYDAIMPTPQGRAAVVRTFISPADPSNASGQVVIVASPVPINNGLWGTASYAYNPRVFRTVPLCLGGSFPDGTSQTLLFTEKYQICGSSPGLGTVQNYWFGSSVGNSSAFIYAPVITGAELLTPAGQYAGGDFLASNLAVAPDSCVPGAPSGAHASGILIGLADASVRFLTAAGATARLGPAPLAGPFAAYDQPVAGALVGQRGYVWSALLTPDGGEVFTVD